MNSARASGEPLKCVREILFVDAATVDAATVDVGYELKNAPWIVHLDFADRGHL